MKIGELALAAQCSTDTIRYYEKIGLIEPAHRQNNNYRTYNHSHLERLCFIRNCRSLDMSQQEIHHLLDLMGAPLNSCSQINLALLEHITHVESRIQELMLLKQKLLDLHQHCQGEQTVEQCPIVQELNETQPLQAIKAHTHLG